VALLLQVRSVVVQDGEHKIVYLNELEWIDGEIWANVWQTECIARICPATGMVKAWVFMHGLRAALEERRLPQNGAMDVLNGIAYDEASKRLFVTGKLWPRVFEVKLEHIPAARVLGSKKLRQRRQSCLARGWSG
jgi:glutamine cyclotransferase